jgi:hypothetical protein
MEKGMCIATQVEIIEAKMVLFIRQLSFLQTSEHELKDVAFVCSF